MRGRRVSLEGRGVAARPALALAAVMVLLSVASPARAELRWGFELGGGSVIDWAAPEETGNAFGGLAFVGLDDLQLGVGVATALPDSRLQAQFESVWAEVRYFVLGHGGFLSPYGVAAAGVAFEDAATILPSGFVPARWSTATNMLFQAGVGLRIGEARGLSLSVDARALNHSHLGLSLFAGYTF